MSEPSERASRGMSERTSEGVSEGASQRRSRTPTKNRTRLYLQAIAEAEETDFGSLGCARDKFRIPDSGLESKDNDRARRGDAQGDRAYHISAALAALGARGRRGTSLLMQEMVEPPRRLYRASEIAAYFGVSRQTIHNYTTMGLITEEDRTEGNHRLYDESVFGALARIQRLKATHRLQDIRRVLESDDGRGGAAAVVEKRDADRGGASE